MTQYVQLPDGSFFPYKDGLTQNDALVQAFSLYPDAFSMKKQEPQKQGSAAGDIWTALKQGAVGSTKALTDIAGADNAASQYLAKKSQELQEQYSTAAKEEMAAQAERMKKAEESGSTWEEIKAGLQNVAEAPLRSTAQGVGSLAPYIPTMLLGGIGGALRLAPGTIAALEGVANVAPKVLGTAQGVGAVKGSVYDAVYQNELEATGNEAAAKMKANAAQSYVGKNIDQILLGGALGYVAGSSGVEKLLTKQGAEAAAAGMGRRVARTMGQEAITEGPQGAQERLAANLALQREGKDVPTMQGVVGQGLQEGLIGALSGAPAGALRGPDVAGQQRAAEEKRRQEEALRAQAEAERLANMPVEGPEGQFGLPGMGEQPVSDMDAQAQQLAAEQDRARYGQQANAQAVMFPQLPELPTTASKIPALPEYGTDLNRQVRLINQRLDELREQAKNTPDLEGKIKIGEEFAQLQNTKKELEKQITTQPKAADEVLKGLRRQMAVAEEQGDVLKQVKIAQKIQELGGVQESFDLKKFKGTSESKQEFGDRVIARDMAAGREAAVKHREQIENELKRLREMGVKASDPEYARLAREERQAQLEVEQIERQAEMNRAAPAQGDLFGELTSTARSGRTEQEIIADLRIARNTNDRKAAEGFAQELRAFREGAGKTVDKTLTTESLQGKLPAVPKQAEQQQAAIDKRAKSFADIVDILSKYNQGRAKIEDLEAARKSVIDGLVGDVEATRGEAMGDAEKAQLARDANALLGELVRRSGDTRTMVSKGTKEKPLFIPAQNAQGEFITNEVPGMGFPTAESAVPGYQTFGNRYAATMSIKEGLDNLRNQAVGTRGYTPFTAQFTPESTTPEMVRAELDRAFAKDPETYTPEQRGILEQITNNLGAIQVSPDKEQRSVIGNWLHRLNVKAGPEGTVQVKGGREPRYEAKLDPLTNDVKEILRGMEAGKRSETEGGKTAIQQEITTGEERGKVFASPEEFYKYLASDALQQLRTDIGLVGPTLARLQKRIEPFVKKAEKLRDEATKYSADLERMVAARKEQFDSLQEMNAEEVKRETARINEAKELVAQTEADLKAVTDRLDKELTSYVIEYMQARSAFEFSVKTSEDITKLIQDNEANFTKGEQQALDELAQAKNDLSTFSASVLKGLAHPKGGGAPSSEGDTFSEKLANIKEAFRPGTAFLQFAVVEATRNLQRTLSKNNTTPRITAYLEKDLDLQMQLAEEAGMMDSLVENMLNAGLALDEAKKKQDRSIKNRKEIKQATQQVEAAKELLDEEKQKAAERAETVSKLERELGFEKASIKHRISETETDLLRSTGLVTQAERALSELIKPLQEQAKALEGPANAALRAFTRRRDRLAQVKEETQAERETRDRQQRKLELDALDRLAAMEGERISFEQRRQMLEQSGTSDEAIGEIQESIDSALGTIDHLREAVSKLDTGLADINKQIAKLEKATATNPRTFQKKLEKNSKLVELAGLRDQRDAMMRKQEQAQAGIAALEKEVAKADEALPKLLVQKEYLENVILAKEGTESIQHKQQLKARIEKRMGEVAELMKKKQYKIAEAKTDKLRKSRQNDLSRYKREYRELETQRGLLTGIERTQLPVAPLETEAVEPGMRLRERKIGPTVKKTVQAGNIRTGVAETAEERKLSSRNKATQAGKARPVTPKQAAKQGNIAAVNASDETRLAAEDRLDNLVELRDNTKRVLENANFEIAAREEDGEDVTPILAKKERLETAIAQMEKEIKSLRTALKAEPAPDTEVYRGDGMEFSRGAVNNGTTATALQKELDKIVGGKGITQSKVRVFDSVDAFYAQDLNAKYDYPDIPSDAKAFVDPKTGKAVMFANNIGKGEGLGVLLHEVGAHLGFRNLFNAAQYNGLVNTIKTWAARNDGSIESQVAKAAMARVEAAQTTDVQYDDELLAYAVEEAVKAGVSPDAMKGGSALRSWLNSVLNTLKKALADMGFLTDKLTAGDLVNLAYGAAQLEMRGTWHGSDATFTAFDTKYAGTGEGVFDRRFDGDNSLGVGPYVTPDKAYGEYYQHAIPFGKAAMATGYGNKTYQDYRDMDENFINVVHDALSVAAMQNKYESRLLTAYVSSVSAGGDLDPTKNKEVQKTLDAWQKLARNKPKDAKAIATLSADKIKGFTKRPAQGSLYRTLDDIPREKVFSVNSTATVGERPAIDALRKKYGASYITRKDGTKVDIDLQDNQYPLNGMFYKMRRELGIKETVRLLKDAGIEAIEQKNDRKYIERAYIDNAPEILAVNLKPVGKAEGVLYSRGAVPTSLAELASKVVAQPKTFREKLGNNVALQTEMELVDMRAPAREALKVGDDKLYQQAMYNILKADQKMAIVQATLTDGAMESFTDEAGLRVFKSSNKNSAVPVFKAVSEIPADNAKTKVDLATTYLIAQRALNKGASKLDTGALGIDENMLRQVLRDVDADPALKTSLEKVRSTYNAYNEGLVKFLAESGKISKKKAAELLKDGDYVPFYRVQEDGTAELVYGDGVTVAIGDIRNQPYLQELKGGESKILPLDESIYRNTLLLTDAALTNMATKETAYGLQALGKGKGPVDPATGKPTSRMVIRKGKGHDSKNVIRFNQEPDPNDKNDDGSRHLVVDTTGTLAEGVPTALVVDSLAGAHLPLPAFLKAAGFFSDLLRAGITRMPMYIGNQLMRDPMSATFTAGLNYGPFRAVAKAGREFWRMSTGDISRSSQLIERGLIQSNIFAGDQSDISKIALQLASGKDMSALEKVFAFMDKAALNADAATRLLVYENARKNGLSDGQAQIATMESMNFYKRGRNPVVQYGNRLIPFLNAGIQGLNVLFQAARGNMPYEEQQAIKQKFYKRAAFLFATGVVYAMAMEDDEYYKNARPRDKYTKLFLHLPGVEEPIKLPTPFEAGYFFSLAVATVDAMRNEVPRKEQWDALRGMFIGSIPGASSMGVPQIIRPMIEVWANKNFYSGAPIESARLEGMDIEKRVNANTTEFAKLLAKVIPGLSPVQIEHLANGYLGQAPMLIAAAANKLLETTDTGEAPAKRLHETPFVGQAFQRKYGGADTDYMYRLAKEATEARTTFNTLRKQGKLDEAKEFLAENKAKIALSGAAGAYREAAGRINADVERTRNRKDLSGAEKTARIEQLEKAKQDLAARFAGRFERLQAQR